LIGPELLPSAQAFVLCTGVHCTVTVPVSAQLVAGSPSEAVTVSVAVPGVVQVKRGLAELGSLNVPELAVQ
jgi:hypothetical protein